MTGRANISFKCSSDDRQAVASIAERAITVWFGMTGRRLSGLDVSMDILAVHCNGNPLRLRDLLGADDFNFIHDVGGIMRHLDRDTGKLTNHFTPRFTKREQKAA